MKIMHVLFFETVGMVRQLLIFLLLNITAAVCILYYLVIIHYL